MVFQMTDLSPHHPLGLRNSALSATFPNSARLLTALLISTQLTSSLLTSSLLSGTVKAQDSNPLPQVEPATANEFFETRIRPVLVERCYECHNTAETAEADLALDWRDGIRAETEHGRVVVPGKPDQSLLIKVIEHAIPDLEMPEGGPKLDDAVVADFRKWIEMGANDPRISPPTAEELSAETSWEKTLQKRKQWWSFQPIRDVWPPAGDTDEHPIDQFVRAELGKQGLTPAPAADRRTLIRRLSFALTGLPPTPDAIEKFVNDSDDDAFQRVVDQYLRSPQFGERWARHWMDLVRYTDSHGSEGDPEIPHAYRYRDYLIRALNKDVPYDQIVREHIAGDLLAEPRINEELGINESSIGPAHFRFVFHGFAPTDALDEKVRFTDDQINVVSKAFLGLTVSCARCHDHKFDAISQADYYAMFGIFASCRPALRDVNLPAKQRSGVDEIEQLKPQLQSELASDWLAALDGLAAKLLSPDEALQQRIDNAKQPEELLHLWKRLTQTSAKDEKPAKLDPAAMKQAWLDVRNEWQQQHEHQDQPDNVFQWDLTSAGNYADWFAWGNGLREKPTAAGEFTINGSGAVVQGVFPSAVISHSISQRHRGFLASKRIPLDEEYDAWLLVAGEGQPSVRYVVQNYPRDGTVYPIPTINKRHFYWQRLNLKYWTGDQIHLELATSRDAPLRNRNRDQSWFAVRDVIFRKSGEAGPSSVSLEYLQPIIDTDNTPPGSSSELAERIVGALRSAIEAWRDGTLTNEQALLINASLSVLPNELDVLPTARRTIERLREIEAAIPEPTRVPGIVEADAFDQPLFVRGDHRRPGEPVKRRFLEAIDAEPFEPENSGRLQLADSMLHPDNPLTSRVIANRIWHYLFGRGIVSTPDNFGQLGDQPSHPELLDYLARRMVRQRWSIKSMIRFIVMSETWQADSTPSAIAAEKDPENRYLSHANVRRLDAESIRDSLLAVSDQLDSTMYGPGFNANSQVTRRSVYVRSRRNSLDAFLKTFDSPTPFSTTGRRDVTNVPSQSLTMLNDPFVLQLASDWAESTAGPPMDRIRKMIRVAFGRDATPAELQAMSSYVAALQNDFAAQDRERHDIDRQLDATNKAITAIVDPARQRVLNNSSPRDSAADAGALSLQPIAAWNFDDSLQDAVGESHLKLFGNARIEDGALVVDGGFAFSERLPKKLGEKTLEAWVQLSSLDQRGGGVITVQTRNGALFDSVVFGEREPGEWIAGSNGFVRTDDLGGPKENEAQQQAVHVAATYSPDGTIRFYRNGQPYGKSTNKGSLQTFNQSDAQILFGLRHGLPNEGNDGRKLFARLHAARLYDRALTADEVMASARHESFVTEEMLLAELSEQQRDELLQLRETLKTLKEQQDDLPAPHKPNEAWARLAHAIFNLKEFIYLR